MACVWCEFTQLRGWLSFFPSQWTFKNRGLVHGIEMLWNECHILPSCETTALMSPQSGLTRGAPLSLLGRTHGAWWLCFPEWGGTCRFRRSPQERLAGSAPLCYQGHLFRRVLSLETVSKKNCEGRYLNTFENVRCNRTARGFQLSRAHTVVTARLS